MFPHVYFPDWFKPTTGFQYRDPDGDLVIVLGEGGYRSTSLLGNLQLGNPAVSETLYKLEMRSNCLVAVYCYKNEWHLTDLFDRAAYSKTYWDMCRGPIE